ncbi:MAG: flippase-like domain-containing protein [Desulfobacterales bacterium]|uniref:Flippase-like domain-containing protein n=1 Tax=Candidatus Desulfatibia profunda TaxID=2841695 RepID=A0A8J6NQF0_9BACT|nr:flippase-like domain-containing protein [Candidatus Desulfatibia profunda]MBL7178916.1 flippase-like domain-containing protein [Desulfobacterales bacterium]
MKKKATISLILGITLSAVALYLAFRNVPFPELLIYLASINYLWIVPSVLLTFVIFALRAYRWQIILESAHKVGFWQAFHPLMVGFMINCVLPGRVGELARPAVLLKKENVPFSTGLATVAAERVFDIGILIALFAVLLATVQIDPNLDIAFGGYHLNRETLVIAGRSLLQLLLILIAGIVMVCFDKTRKVINNAIMGLPSIFFFSGSDFKKKIQQRYCIPLIHFVENFASGFALVKHPAKIYLCTGISMVIWGLSAFSYYIFSLGCPGIELSFSEISAVMIIICFFIALPSVPGFWGIWEAGGVFALTLFGVSTKAAAGFTLANHAVQIFPVIIIGLVSAMVTSVNILQVSHGNKES